VGAMTGAGGEVSGSRVGLGRSGGEEKRILNSAYGNVLPVSVPTVASPR
jgi:hypothetical protein